jgi:hypothetical protein
MFYGGRCPPYPAVIVKVSAARVCPESVNDKKIARIMIRSLLWCMADLPKG